MSISFSTSISFFFFFFFLLPSSITACDRCVHQSKAAYSSSPLSLSAGACGYGSMALGFNGGHIAAGSSSLYREGIGCGGCFQIRCKNEKLCSSGGVKVILTDITRSNHTDFLLSSQAFMAMARDEIAQEEIRKLGLVEIEYKRIPCEYKNKNLSIRVEENSRGPNYLAIKFLYQGGQTDIVAVDVAKWQVGRVNWRFMSRDNGPVWSTDRVPAGPLQFRMVVTGGYDGKWVWAEKEVLPAQWTAGPVYDLGLQITDMAQEGCYPCDTQEWK